LFATAALAETPARGGTIRGQVEDPASAVIEGASVEIADGDFSQRAKTDAKGSFSFSGLPGGVYKIRISASGFDSKVVETPIADGEMWNLRRIQLKTTQRAAVVRPGSRSKPALPQD
jgi:hypothetical protein